jgi:hypothetical protein
MKSDLKAIIICAVLGLVLVGYLAVYAPMARNYADCGKLTLCEQAPPEQIEYNGNIYERVN